MTPTRSLLALFATLAIVAAPRPAAAAAAPAFDRAAWKADFERIKRGLAQGYSNLDWQVDHRGFNLARADQQISAMLDQATGDAQATLALARLVQAFDDPHLQLLPGGPPDSATLLPRQSDVAGPAAATDACAAKGGKRAGRLAYASAPGWREIGDGPFLAGLIGKTGIIRVPSFGEDSYPDICQQVAKPEMDARNVQLAVRAELNRRLAALIERMRREGMTQLVIDVTGNGGGSEWSSEMAAMFAAGPLKRTAPRMANPACDRTAVWRGERPCSIYAGPPEIEEIAGTGQWTGPLAIFADNRSASATEEFMTWLRGNDRARIAGQRSFGAGCGYVDGGHAIALRAAPLHIMMPNCSRFTGEGVNEIEGIEPDVPVDWSSIKPADYPPLLIRLFSR
ncbi:MAG TPA: S41 family peptidase [Sphingomicrobium sp.]|nr:S41 family peptidase [Sphingomicrobium sp.]